MTSPPLGWDPLADPSRLELVERPALSEWVVR